MHLDHFTLGLVFYKRTLTVETLILVNKNLKKLSTLCMIDFSKINFSVRNAQRKAAAWDAMRAMINDCHNLDGKNGN